MPRYLEFQYTSGIVLNGDRVTEIARHIGYVAKGSIESIRQYYCAQYISKYMADRDESLKLSNLQTFDLLKPQPGTDEYGDPEACWMIATKWDRVKYEIDPETHQNTQRIKAAVIATGIPEECLTEFDTFPNREYPRAIINIIPPHRWGFSTKS